MFYTFYGDDFTGSTDVLEQLALYGVSAVLFLRMPTDAELARFRGVDALGIAGDSRSRSPEWMDRNLPAIFGFMKSMNAQVNHYKVCSTFDSSAVRGSIGRAMEIGSRVFSPRFVPIVVVAPHLRRYVVFGNLFARDSDGEIKRIDRHSMSLHPATPMREADLRRHLAAQTGIRIDLLDLPALREHRAEERRDSLVEGGAGAVLFDGIDDDDMGRSGELLMKEAGRSPMFVVGSSGVTAAVLSARRKASNAAAKVSRKDGPNERGPLLVVSGSCSLVTMAQVQYAAEHGFRSIAVDTAKLCNSETARELVEKISQEVSKALTDGVSAVLYTALGPQGRSSVGNELGHALGVLLKRILKETRQRRVVLCGGDTSSHAVQQLGCYALTSIQATQAGAPLCRIHTDDPDIDGLELVLKGGQVGSRDFFEVVRDL